MLILLTNDDGIFSPGLAAMAQALRHLGEVWIVAPASEQSGVACSITFRLPVLAKEVLSDGTFWGYAVEGTPIDCVKLGIDKLLPGPPGLIVSGINNGLNTGINVLYSGTLGGAFEGAARGIPSFAVSISHIATVEKTPFEKGAQCAIELIQTLLDRGPFPGGLYNINIPIEAIETAPPWEVFTVPVDQTIYWSQYQQVIDPFGRNAWWLGSKPMFDRPENTTDTGVVSQGKIAVTPLNVDSTNYKKIEEIQSWNQQSDSTCAPETNSTSPKIRMYRK